jgi:hypothetical protein
VWQWLKYRRTERDKKAFLSFTKDKNAIYRRKNEAGFKNIDPLEDTASLRAAWISGGNLAFHECQEI